jgi:hypothetical protein
MSIEAMKQALEALEKADKIRGFPNNKKAITAIREAIEQAQMQEPVAWWDAESLDDEFCSFKTKDHTIPLYTSPPQRQPEQAQKQEPVAWYDSKSGWVDFHSFKPVRKPSAPDAEWLPLYTAPSQRQPLTDEQIIKKLFPAGFERNSLGWTFTYGRLDYHLLKFARAIEQAHGIKGEEC